MDALDLPSSVEIFTTRPDTLFGASFLAISPNHPLAAALAKNDPALAEFIAACNRTGTSEIAIETGEKLGYKTPLEAVHPFDSDWKLPIYVANFVLMDYGTGAIFGCPAHDQRDLDFARKYDLPVIPVILPPDAKAASFTIDAEPYVGAGTAYHSRFLDGLDSEAASNWPPSRKSKSAGRGGRDAMASARLVHQPPALLGLPHPDHSLRKLRRGSGTRRRFAGGAPG